MLLLNMYMILNDVPGGTVMDSMGFDVDQLQTRPLVFYGGEGFAQMTGPWRLGGYAGIGSAQVSNVYKIVAYANKDGNPRYQDTGAGVNSDELYTYRDDSNNSVSVKGKLNILLGAMTAEYVFPVYRDLEVMAGALMGLGSYNLSVDTQMGNATWSSLGQSMYGYIQGDSVMVELDANGGTFPDAAAKVEPVFCKPAPSPKNVAAVIEPKPTISGTPENPVLLPTKSPPMNTLFAIPTPPSITTAPLVTAVELVVSLNLASCARISASVISCLVLSDNLKSLLNVTGPSN